MAIDRELAAIAATQYSLIRLRDIEKFEGDKYLAARRVRAGIWDAVGHEVYRIAGVPWSYQAEVLAAIFVAGDGAVASHQCAARLMGVGFAHAPVEITVPRKRFHRPKGAIVHTSRDLDRCAIADVRGIPATEAARVLLDLAGSRLGPQSIGRAVEQARRLELVTWTDLGNVLATHARRGRPGVKKLREVIATGSVNEGITETDGELFALGLLRDSEFGEPVLQHELRDDDGTLVCKMDFAYLPDRVNFEIDGSVHLQPEVKRKDDARDAAARRRGWTVRRVWCEIPVLQPDEFLKIVRDTFRDARGTW
ncbi:MAG: hypothetical protein Q8K63_08480 [Acidimicrobiales bacterium]|nr:hypothetical protein [Acidimicrobiales bacterium]